MEDNKPKSFFEKIKDQVVFASKVHEIRKAVPSIPFEEVLQLAKEEIERDKQNNQ